MRRPSPRTGGPHPVSPSRARIRSTIASVVDVPDELRDLRTFHKVLADANRLRIVRRLSEGPATVTELIDYVGVSQPLVSWHLRRLKVAGLVETRRSGREVICTLSRGALERFHAKEHEMLGMTV